MKNNNYKNGEDICKKIFWKTGDLRYYNMANGFKELSR